MASIMRVMGLREESHFTNYHRVLNRACWSGLQASKILFCLWHTPGQKPVPIRWVLVVDPEGKYKPEAFFSTDTQLTPVCIVEYFVLRWGVEVTFEESRRHLGVETQRQWADKAIARATPVLMGLFSIVCLLAERLSKGRELTPEVTSWYQKHQVTFSDVFTFVRRQIWDNKYNKSADDTGYILFHPQEWESLLDQLAAAA